jgi:dihydroorotate dehydrogenase
VAEDFRMGRVFRVPVGINLGKNRDTPLERAAEDYQYGLERLFRWADFFVVNVSSPNTPELRALQSPEKLRPMLKGLRDRAADLARIQKQGRRPLLFVKISPDEDQGEGLVEAVVESGFDGIVATNTTTSREGLPPGAPAEGGLSGAPLRERATETLRRLYALARGRLAFIGVGGVFSAEDAYEKIRAGASLVEVYTGFVYRGPSLIRDIHRGLVRLLKRDGFSGVAEAVGKG